MRSISEPARVRCVYYKGNLCISGSFIILSAHLTSFIIITLSSLHTMQNFVVSSPTSNRTCQILAWICISFALLLLFQAVLTNSNSIKTDVEHEHIHVVFTTDCGQYQDWQSILLFHSAKISGHTGRVTRVACGCSSRKKVKLIDTYHKLYPHYDIFFAPDFSSDKNQNKCKI